jgi:hypothetical protein
VFFPVKIVLKGLSTVIKKMKAMQLFIGSLLFLSCHQKEGDKKFDKESDGLEYKVISENLGDTPKEGQYLKLQVKQVYNDSLLSDTRNLLPQYQKFDSAEMTKESHRIFSNVHVGDSLVFKLSSDSALKAIKPAFAKRRGGYIPMYV